MKKLKIGDTIKLNERYWEDGKAQFGKNLKSFKTAKIVAIDGDLITTDKKNIGIINQCFIEKVK